MPAQDNPALDQAGAGGIALGPVVVHLPPDDRGIILVLRDAGLGFLVNAVARMVGEHGDVHTVEVSPDEQYRR